jgi:hypothetical protein
VGHAMSTANITVDGLLRPDGTLELDTPPRLPPGRVRITLQPLGGSRTQAERLPDPPWADDAIPAPFDLPRPGPTERVEPRPVVERLPEPPEWMQENGQ